MGTPKLTPWAGGSIEVQVAIVRHGFSGALAASVRGVPLSTMDDVVTVMHVGADGEIIALGSIGLDPAKDNDWQLAAGLVAIGDGTALAPVWGYDSGKTGFARIWITP